MAFCCTCIVTFIVAEVSMRGSRYISTSAFRSRQRVVHTTGRRASKMVARPPSGGVCGFAVCQAQFCIRRGGRYNCRGRSLFRRTSSVGEAEIYDRSGPPFGSWRPDRAALPIPVPPHRALPCFSPRRYFSSIRAAFHDDSRQNYLLSARFRFISRGAILRSPCTQKPCPFSLSLSLSPKEYTHHDFSSVSPILRN